MTLLGCAPEAPLADPAPSFASDEEAFAAAEATYRAYVDALNDVDLSDPETFEGVYAWTTGEANAGAREEFSAMHADHLAVIGPTVLSLAVPSTRQPSGGGVALDICLDVSGVSLVDETGKSVVDDDRRDVQSMWVEFSPSSDSGTALLISAIEGRTGAPICDD